jgi:hypothetical protein
MVASNRRGGLIGALEPLRAEEVSGSMIVDGIDDDCMVSSVAQYRGPGFGGWDLRRSLPPSAV